MSSSFFSLHDSTEEDQGSSTAEGSRNKSHHSLVTSCFWLKPVTCARRGRTVSFVLFSRTLGLHARVFVMSNCWASGEAT